MIALDNCSSRVREDLRGELHQFEGRLKSLLDNSAPIKTLPLSPEAILEAFVAAIDEDMIAVEVQLELIRMFDISCFDKRYEEMLGVANQMLEDAGFSPLAEKELAEKEFVDEKPVDNEPVHKDPKQKPSELVSTQENTAEHTVADEIDKVNEAVANYSDTGDQDQPSSLGNSRIQTELLAKITSMLEQAELASTQADMNSVEGAAADGGGPRGAAGD